VRFVPNRAWDGFENAPEAAVTGLFLGGGSWEDAVPLWPEAMKRAGVRVKDFSPANVGYEVEWSEAFLKEAEGKPLKNIVFKNRHGEKAGELVVTRYGLEGTPVYFLGDSGEAFLDLKPGLTESEILTRLSAVRENWAPFRRVQKLLSLPEASLALLYHHTPESVRGNLEALVRQIKHFPVELLRPRPLLEAISSTGGIDLDEVSMEVGHELELKRFPGVFVGGEMLDWWAPTGGFLIQAAVTQGAMAGRNMLKALRV
jgi:predicted flavoprotein YhiN